MSFPELLVPRNAFHAWASPGAHHSIVRQTDNTFRVGKVVICGVGFQTWQYVECTAGERPEVFH